MNNIAVKVEDLTVAYQDKIVLMDVDLTIQRGIIMGIIGPNGAGKSTLLKAILNLVKPVCGNVNLYDSDNKENKRKIAYVPQSETVDWDYPATVFDVVLMGRYSSLSWFKRPKERDKELAKEMLDKVGMLEFKDRQISRLSGGQQQRVFLARAMVQEADIYFMDEPFKGVDVKTEAIMIGLLKELRNQGKTIIVVHHDLETVEEIFDEVTMIRKRVMTTGAVSKVFTKENLQKTYHSNIFLDKGRKENGYV